MREYVHKMVTAHCTANKLNPSTVVAGYITCYLFITCQINYKIDIEKRNDKSSQRILLWAWMWVKAVSIGSLTMITAQNGHKFKQATNLNLSY